MKMTQENWDALYICFIVFGVSLDLLIFYLWSH